MSEGTLRQHRINLPRRLVNLMAAAVGHDSVLPAMSAVRGRRILPPPLVGAGDEYAVLGRAIGLVVRGRPPVILRREQEFSQDAADRVLNAILDTVTDAITTAMESPQAEVDVWVEDGDL